MADDNAVGLAAGPNWVDLDQKLVIDFTVWILGAPTHPSPPSHRIGLDRGLWVPHWLIAPASELPIVEGGLASTIDQPGEQVLSESAEYLPRRDFANKLESSRRFFIFICMNTEKRLFCFLF